MIKTTKVAMGRELRDFDTILYEGALWLVPAWLDNLDTGKTRPGLLVGGPGMIFEEMQDGYLLKHPVPLPEALLHGAIPPGQEALFRILETPDIWFPIPPGAE